MQMFIQYNGTISSKYLHEAGTFLCVTFHYAMTYCKIVICNISVSKGTNSFELSICMK